MTALTAFTWDGAVMRPLPRFRAECEREFERGRTYLLEAQEHRSAQSHRFYFATVADYWSNLPERFGNRWPTPDHLRKYALIKTGWCDSQSLVCSSNAKALRLAAFVRPIDEFSVVDVSAACVTVYRAKSQRQRAMDKVSFQKSSADVLAFLADMIGADARKLEAA